LVKNKEFGLLLSLCLKEIAIIFRYDFDCGALGVDVWLIFVPSMVLMYLLMILKLLELGSHVSLCNATDEINILLVGILHDGNTSI